MQYLKECVKFLKEIKTNDKEYENKIGNIVNYITKSVPIDYLKRHKDTKSIEQIIKEMEKYWHESNI